MSVAPVSVPLGLTTGPTVGTDGTGAYTFTTQIHPANWAVVRLVAQTGGFPSWTLFQDAALPLEYGQGPLVSLGQVLVAPGQRVQVVVTAANPNATVLGQYVGVMSPSLEEVLPYYVPSPNPVGAQTVTPTQLVGSLSGGGNPSQSFPLPAGTLCVGFLSTLTGAGNPNVKVTGDQTGVVYLNLTNPTAGPHVVLLARDTTVTLALTAGLASGTVFLLAWTSQAVVSLANLENPVPVTFTSSNPALVAQPALWLAPQNVTNINEAIGAGADSAFIINGIAAQNIYLHDLDLQQDAATAGPDFRLVLRDNTTPTPNDLHTMSINQTFPWHKSFRGTKAAAGQSVLLHNFGSGATAIRGSITWSRG